MNEIGDGITLKPDLISTTSHLYLKDSQHYTISLLFAVISLAESVSLAVNVLCTNILVYPKLTANSEAKKTLYRLYFHRIIE